MINNFEVNGAVINNKMQTLKPSAKSDATDNYDNNNNDKYFKDRNVPTEFNFCSSTKFNCLNVDTGASGVRPDQENDHENSTTENTYQAKVMSQTALKSLNINTINDVNYKSKLNANNIPSSHYYSHGNSGAIKRGCEDVENENEDDLVTSISSSTSCSRRSPPKKPKFVVTSEEMNEYFDLLHQTEIQDFLQRDVCNLISDKYALAMVFTYFKRAKFNLQEYTKDHFYLALYLASDIEEDIDEYKYEIFPWALGTGWRSQFSSFLRRRDALLRRIGYRAIVSRKCCEEVMSFKSDHYAWKRERAEDHGGATRAYLINRSKRFLLSKSNLEDDELNLPRLPEESPRPCPLCLLNRGWNSTTNSINTLENNNKLAIKPDQQTSYAKGYSLIKRQKSNDYTSKQQEANALIKSTKTVSKKLVKTSPVPIKDLETNSETESEITANNTELNKDSKMSAANKFQKVKMTTTELDHRPQTNDLNTNTENSDFSFVNLQRHSSLVSVDKFLIKDSFDTSDDNSSSEDDVFSVEKNTTAKFLMKKQELLKLNNAKLRASKISQQQQNPALVKKRNNYSLNNTSNYNLRSHSVNAQKNSQKITNQGTRHQIVPII